MTDLNKIAQNYITAWNESDAERRADLLKATFTEDVSYRDPLMQGDGHAGVAALIDGVQQRFAGFRFALTGAPNGYGEYVRFSWSLGPAGDEAPIEGSDVLEIVNGRIARVIGFLDKVPQAA